MTGFYIKKTLSDQETSESVEAYFRTHFPQFIGKHTEWLLLNEPELTWINPCSLNSQYKQLRSIYN